MAKIENIGLLDVREIREEVAENITSIENVGILIESDKSQILLKNAKKVNIGMTLKVPSDKKINVAIQNGSQVVDKEYLEGIDDQVAFIANGELIFKNDVDLELLKEKLFTVMVNGEIICPRRLSSTIQSRGTINGYLTSYSSDYTLINGKVKFNNGFLRSLKGKSKISVEKLIVLDPIDSALLNERISNIEVLKKLIILEDLEGEISNYIDNYYSVNKEIIPNISKEIHYIDKRVKIDNNFLMKYNEAVLYVDGKVDFNLEENTDFGKHIKLLLCKSITCDKKTYDMIKDNIGENVEVEIIEENVFVNNGNMRLTGSINDEMIIKNMGKLQIDDNLDMESFAKNVLEIKNYGLIVVPEDKLAMVKEKVKENKGAIISDKDKREKGIEKEKEDILYSNMGELKL